MNPESPQSPQGAVEEESLPPSGHGRMPLFLLFLWIANISFFIFYLIRFGWPDLQKWLGK